MGSWAFCWVYFFLQINSVLGECFGLGMGLVYLVKFLRIDEVSLDVANGLDWEVGYILILNILIFIFF